MTESAMRQIVKAAEQDETVADKVKAWDGTYSGRGMGGTVTFAVVVESIGALLNAVAYAVRDSDDPDQLAEDLKNIRTDSLCRDIVVY